VAIASAEFAPGGTLTNWTASPQNTGSDASDSDGDPATHSASQVLGSGVEDFTVDFGFHIASGYAISQKLNGFNPVRLGDPISFTISITNTGSTWLTMLPLAEAYDPAYLQYGAGAAFAAPDSNDHGDDGQVNWSDLTGSTLAGLDAAAVEKSSGGWGADLGPGSSRDVTVWFTTREDTSDLPGGVATVTASVTGAMADPDGANGPLPAVGPVAGGQGQGTAGIVRPTGVDVYGLTATRAGDSLAITWQTGNEAQIVGFNVQRAAAEGEFVPINSALVPAEHPGANQGAAYLFVDAGAGCAAADLATADFAACTYRIEVVMLSGTSAYVGPVVEQAAARVLLPLMLRQH